jgi:hypothetical protein
MKFTRQPLGGWLLTTASGSGIQMKPRKPRILLALVVENEVPADKDFLCYKIKFSLSKFPRFYKTETGHCLFHGGNCNGELAFS